MRYFCWLNQRMKVTRIKLDGRPSGCSDLCRWQIIRLAQLDIATNQGETSTRHAPLSRSSTFIPVDAFSAICDSMLPRAF